MQHAGLRQQPAFRVGSPARGDPALVRTGQRRPAPQTRPPLQRMPAPMQKGLERCAHLVDSQENYFKLKID